MRRILTVVLCLAFALVGAGVAQASPHHRRRRRRRVLVGRLIDGRAVVPPPIGSTTVQVVDLANAPMPDIGRIELALTQQINVRLHDVWHTPLIRFVDSGPADVVVLVTTQQATAGFCGGDAWGCHWQSNGKLLADVQLDESGAPYSTVMSHELIELLIDPTGSAQLFGLPREACDPVDGMAYFVGPVNHQVGLSDFVYPSWFNPAGRPPFDAMRLVHEPRADHAA